MTIPFDNPFDSTDDDADEESRARGDPETVADVEDLRASLADGAEVYAELRREFQTRARNEKRRKERKEQEAMLKEGLDSEMARNEAETHQENAEEFRDRVESFTERLGKLRRTITRLEVVRGDLRVEEVLGDEALATVQQLSQAAGEEDWTEDPAGFKVEAIHDEVESLVEDVGRQRYPEAFLVDEEAETETESEPPEGY